MSTAYVFDADNYGAAAPAAMAPLERRFFGGNDADFVCNVSDDDTVERDIDLEIEARIRSLTFLSDDDSALVGLSMAAPPPTTTTTTTTTSSAQTPQLPRTLSQRMLLSLHKAKMSQSQRTHRTASGTPQQRTRTTPKVSPEAAAVGQAPPVRNERSFYSIDEAESEPRSRGDSQATQLSGRSTSSCTDRLEARISKSFLNRQDSIEGAADANDFSAMYSGRRTYPAESVRKTDQRLSEAVPTPVKQDTRMTTALEKERKALALAGLDNLPRRVEPEIDNVRHGGGKKIDQGVSFHFQGGSSSTLLSGGTTTAAVALTPTRKPRPAPESTNRFTPQLQQQSLAMVVPTRQSSSSLDPKYTALASQLGDIETLIDGIENCLAESSTTFSSLAPAVLGELDLLNGATAQIRKNGATLILAEVGRPPTETINALRRLVTRAAAVQSRIKSIMLTTSNML